MPELAWLAGWISYQLGRYGEARRYAELALAIGPQPQRAGFSYPKAQRELPEQLLRWAEFQLTVPGPASVPPSDAPPTLAKRAPG